MLAPRTTGLSHYRNQLHSAGPGSSHESVAPLKNLELYRRLVGQLRPYWPQLLGIVAISFLSIPAALLTPLPLKIAVDSVIGSKPLPAPFAGLTAAYGEVGTLLLAAGLVVVIA